MHGPYSAYISMAGQTTLVAREEDLAGASAAAERFYQDATPALAQGATRCAVFYAAALLQSGEQAEVAVFGAVGSGKSERPCQYSLQHVRRESDGSLVTTLGRKFGERVFSGA